MSTRPRTCRPLLVAILATAVLISGCASSGGQRAASTGRAAAATTAATTAAAGAPSSTTAVPGSTTSPSTTGTTTTTALPPPTTAAPPPLPTETGDLAGGAHGARTRAVQKALHDEMYDPGPADGSFGLKTTQSVWAWQALHGQPRTGVVSPDTERLILARAAQPMLRPDLGPTHSEVDLTRQVLLVFRAGKPALITHVSTGSGRHYCDKGSCGTAITGRGSFHFQRRVKGWRHAPLGLLYNPVYFNGGIAVHGAPSVPNDPASHGCVRIPMHIAEYFPGLVAKGDPVVVI